MFKKDVVSMKNRKLIVVLGMHRSGTSAITRGLQVLGVELGDRLMLPVAGVNDKGFWEDIDLNAFNIEALSALGSDWNHLVPIDAADVAALRKNNFFLRAVELIRSKTSTAPVFGFKDPRVAKLLPFWKEVFAHCKLDVGYVLTVRHPLSVVKSLAKRDGFDAEKSYLLWLGHVLASITYSLDERLLLVDYDRLMQEPGRELNRIANYYGLRVDLPELQIFQAEFLDESLRHSRYELNDLALDKACPPLVHEVYGEILKLASEPEEIDHAALKKIAAQWTSEFERIKPALQLVDRLFTQKADAFQTVAERDGQINSLNQALAERDGQINSLNQALAERDGQINSLNQTRAKHADQIDELNTEIVKRGEWGLGLDKQLSRLNDEMVLRTEWALDLDKQLKKSHERFDQALVELAEHDLQISSLTDETIRLTKWALGLANQLKEAHAEFNLARAERDGRIAELNNEVVWRGEWAQSLVKQLQEAQSSIAAITSSNSWRITRPLREGSLWLTQPSSQARRYLRRAAKLVKSVYARLPLNSQTRTAHKFLLEKHLPWILRASKSQPIALPALPLPRIVEQQDPPIEARGIKIAMSAQPVVSVIIPIFGKCEYTLRCLTSIALNSPSTPFEVIVVDDCSPDNSAEILREVEGIWLISNLENQGFIRSCNIGAALASGQYLHFLNNDTEVTPGWLDELVRTFHEFPGTGLAGSKLVYPDGTLQEAGGIIWRDGSAWNFGRNQDPSLPIYNYAREVDYCSGASIMVPRPLFEELGGFDTRYLPAYCEDSDLALKIRDRGHRVIYQPLSIIVHHEGITSGTDTSQGTKAYQVDNLKKQFQRWKSRLENHQVNGTDVDRAKDRQAKRRVLVLDHCTPAPNEDAGSIIVFNLLLLLREMGFQVTFIPEDNFLYMPAYTPALQRVGIEVLYAPYCTSVEQHLKESGKRYDLAFLFRPVVVERHLKTIRKYCPGAKVLFHTVDLHYLRMSREAELLSDPAKQKAADEMKKTELAAIRAVDASIVVSMTEQELLRPELPNERIHVFPLIMDIRGSDKAFINRRDIVFVGGYQHIPNVDAVQYFVKEIMPILRERLPGVRFHAVGSKVPPVIQALASEDVIIAGFVEDLASLLDRMRVAVAPLRYGAGIKGKIGTAMSVGLPTVATSLAAEGMSLTEGENILVADGAKAFADAVVRLYEDEPLWNALSKAGVEFAKKSWGAEAAWETLNSILGDIGFSSIRRNTPLTLYTPHCERSLTDENETLERPHQLTPIAVVRSRAEFSISWGNKLLKQSRLFEKTLLDYSNSKAFTLNGFCLPCGKEVSFLVDMLSAEQPQDNDWLPNWREKLECPLCRMNNRQRLTATLVKQMLDTPQAKYVYFMEQVTPIYRWATATFKNHSIVGSEYLGHEYAGGAIIKGIRQEDVENLSFPDEALDLIVSNDVFEHVPNPARAFAECARVLKTGGVVIATFPFHSNNDLSITCAKLIDGRLQHILPASYHGNPVSEEGSLVFTDFGWDVLNDMKAAGFSDVCVEVYASAAFGHLGGATQLVFRLTK